MPQMYPMNWFLFPMIFNLIFYLMGIILFYLYCQTIPIHVNMLYKHNLKMLW